jgi:hypothetical protein
LPLIDVVACVFVHMYACVVFSRACMRARAGARVRAHVCDTHERAAAARVCRAMSVVFAGKPELEDGDKIIMPERALEVLTRLNVQYPMKFQVRVRRVRVLPCARACVCMCVFTLVCCVRVCARVVSACACVRYALVRECSHARFWSAPD